MTQSSQQDMI